MSTGIEWTDETWNPVTGCTKVSPGCDHCYAETFYERFNGKGSFSNIKLHSERLAQPLRWRKTRRVFVNSMSDLFHADVPAEFIAEVFAVMAACPQHTFQILTKRHARMRSLLSSSSFASDVRARQGKGVRARGGLFDEWPLPNVWLGVSVESQQWADIRVPALLDTPAAIRFLSCEPLLGPVDLASSLPAATCRCGHLETDHSSGHRTEGCQGGNGSWENPICGCRKLRGEQAHNLGDPYANHGLHWVIAGGESGPDARPMHPDWARSLRDQCTNANVPFFFKQWGSWAPTGHTGIGRPAPGATYVGDPVDEHGFRVEMRRVAKKAAGRELDGREWSQYPHTEREQVGA